MKKTSSIRIMGIGVMLCASAVGAADYNCPAKIETDQHGKKIPVGWQTFIDPANQAHTFQGVRFYDGEPKGMANLKPENGDANQSPVWTFGARQSGRSIWEVCVYSDTSVMLSKKIPDTIKNCRVTSTNASQNTQSILCE
jgi:hypothetical protein